MIIFYQYLIGVHLKKTEKHKRFFFPEKLKTWISTKNQYFYWFLVEIFIYLTRKAIVWWGLKLFVLLLAKKEKNISKEKYRRLEAGRSILASVLTPANKWSFLSKYWFLQVFKHVCSECAYSERLVSVEYWHCQKKYAGSLTLYTVVIGLKLPFIACNGFNVSGISDKNPNPFSPSRRGNTAAASSLFPVLKPNPGVIINASTKAHGNIWFFMKKRKHLNFIPIWYGKLFRSILCFSF